jgi:DNA polymerase-3 subunit chi
MKATQFNIYKLSKSEFQAVFTKLLEKVIVTQQRAVVLCKDTEEVLQLDSMLWTYSQLGFLPHATDADPYCQEHPIYLTTTLQNPNKASVLIVTQPEMLQKAKGFEKAIYISNNNDSKTGELEKWLQSNPKEEILIFTRNTEGQWKKNVDPKSKSQGIS